MNRSEKVMIEGNTFIGGSVNQETVEVATKLAEAIIAVAKIVQTSPSLVVEVKGDSDESTS